MTLHFIVNRCHTQSTVIPYFPCTDLNCHLTFDHKCGMQSCCVFLYFRKLRFLMQNLTLWKDLLKERQLVKDKTLFYFPKNVVLLSILTSVQKVLISVTFLDQKYHMNNHCNVVQTFKSFPILTMITFKTATSDQVRGLISDK